MDNNDKLRKNDKVKESSLTYDDYAAIDDGNRYELVQGQLELMSPGPSSVHQMIGFEIQKKLTKSCETAYFILYAPIDVILSEEEVRQPDIVLIHRERKNVIKKRGITGAPDLIVEILSPSTLKRDKIDKRKTYAYYAIPEYWIVDPESFILEQFVLDNGQYELFNIFQQKELVTSPNIRCVSFTMAEIMENIPDIQD
ncbi:Uma2 family endonuclease [Virgibacillus kimchii]